MNNSINLLEDKKKKKSIIPSSASQLMRYSAVGLLFVVSVSSMILFILIALSPLPQLKKQERLTVLTLSQQQTDMMKLFLIKERTTAIEKILSQRKPYDATLDAVQSKLPNGVEINALTIEKNTLSLTISSKSLELLNTFVSSLITEVNEKRHFSQITMSKMSMERERSRYLVTLTFLML